MAGDSMAESTSDSERSDLSDSEVRGPLMLGFSLVNLGGRRPDGLGSGDTGLVGEGRAHGGAMESGAW